MVYPDVGPVMADLLPNAKKNFNWLKRSILVVLSEEGPQARDELEGPFWMNPLLGRAISALLSERKARFNTEGKLEKV